VLLKKNESVDVVVRGEGEITFWDLIRCFAGHRSFKKVLGITYKSRGRKRANPDRPRIQNLGRLPIPDRSLINYPEYIRRATNSLTLNRPVGAIMSSRGCPYACSFCVVSSVWTTKWIGRSASNILQEIEYFSQEYDVREICFLDDQLLGSQKRVLELCNLIHKKSLCLSFTVPSGLTPGRLNNEILHALALVDQNRLIEFCYRAENGYFRDHLRDFLNPTYLFTEFTPKLLPMARLKYFLQLVKFQLARQFTKAMEDVNSSCK